MPKLTRYLYSIDHVKTALTDAIIAQSDFEEVLFWADELYSSGFTKVLNDTIWLCFYIHFAARNPLMEKYIRRKLASDDPWTVLKNLFHRQMCENVECEPKRGRKPKWLDDLTDNKHIKNVILSPSLATITDYAKHNSDMSLLYTTLIAFYTSKGFSTSTPDIEFFASHSREIQCALILSLMTMMLLTKDEIHTKKIYFLLSDEDTWFLNYIRGDVDTEGRKIPAYRLLNERRLFPEPNGFTGNLLENKEMLCETPLWRARFSECADDEEKFCEMYDYQPDDYCKRIM
jgi:hypothetical protein